MRHPALALLVTLALTENARAEAPAPVPAPAPSGAPAAQASPAQVAQPAASAPTEAPVATVPEVATAPAAPAPPGSPAPSASAATGAEPVATPPAPVGPLPPPVSFAPAPEPPRPAPLPAPARSLIVALELAGGLGAGGRVPAADAGLGTDEVIDSTASFGAWLGSRSGVYGLSIERLGLGKDHGGSLNGNSLSASYLTDTLWLSGRWYFTESRPAFYVALAAGPTLPRVRVTGTRVTTDTFVTPIESYSCARAGRVGAGVALAGGGEFDIAEAWSFLTEARVSGHFTSDAADAFSGCAPGMGAAVTGVLRIGLAYRFGG